MSKNSELKILNLYSGIGGNRKLWQDVEVTAVEINKAIASIYKDLYPDDNVIICDAHEYLLNNYNQFDFIWASPPCPTHSKLRLLSVNRGLIKLEYPDMKLYQEIIILKHFFKGKFIVENVQGYYSPLIQPQEAGRHYFWANFNIRKIKTKHLSIKNRNDIILTDRMNEYGFKITDWHGYKGDKHKLFKNCVNPELGLQILEQAQGIIRQEKTKQIKLFNEAVEQRTER